MLIYKKYIVKTIIPPLLTLSIVLTVLIWITQILKLLYLIDKGISFIDFFKLIILVLPFLFFMISPLVMVLVVIYVYNGLQEDRQLIILKAHGLSNYALIKPALFIATIITLISYYISLHLMPLSYNKLKHELSNFRETYISNIIDERTFNHISKNATIYVDKKNDDSTLEGIVLFDNKVPRAHTVLFAETGRIIINDNIPIFQLKKGYRYAFDEHNNLTNLYFDNLLVEIKTDNLDQPSRNKTSTELYIQEMLWPDENLPEEKKIRLRIDGHQRLIWPLFNYCLVFLALSTFLNRPHNRKANTKQIIYTLAPLIMVTYFHFTLQKISYQQHIYIVGNYINLVLCIIFSIWQSNKRSL